MIIFILLYTILHIILFLVSFFKIRNNNLGTLDFIYKFSFPFGAFVWEDLLIFSLFNLVIVITLLAFKDLRIGLLLFIVFWIVRSAGETIYFFLQQFFHPKYHPHFISAHFWILKKFLGKLSDQQCFIIMQVTFQTLSVIFISALILLLKFWPFIPSGF
ncbi:hypothetical protein HY029_02805 [Candidatus Gottesmanbacteria bacterium]|nr:hypothetical protein [Candidatus Gottesmanbacteria bacterium]